MSKIAIAGWITMLVGTALWFFGYFTTGHPPFIAWHAHTPWWIADFLPNVEAEIGMALSLASMVPIHWSTKAPKSQ